MTRHLRIVEKIVMAAAIGVMLAALVCSMLAPVFLLDNDLVYGGF